MPPKKLVKNKKKKSSKAKMQMSSAPLAKSYNVKLGSPSIKQLTDGAIQVSHCEILQQVTGSVLFDNDLYAINPGLVTTFPWLSSIAKDYESYTFKKLAFHYVPTCAASVTGIVSMACDFDSSDAAAGSLVDLMNYHNSSTAAAWQEQSVLCSSLDLTKFAAKRFNLYGALPASSDVKTFNVCTFQFAREGFAGTDACGFVFADYVVEFQTPQLNLVGDTFTWSYTTVALDAPFTTLVSGGGIVVSNVDNDELVFNSAGSYWIDLKMTGTVTVDALPTLTVGGTAATNWSFGQNAAATTKCCTYYINNVKKGDLLHLDWTGCANTISADSIYILRK